MILFRVLKFLEKSSFELNKRLVLFSFVFLPLIKRSYFPNLKENMPTFERRDLLTLFWALFFTFRFQRSLFENSMDMLRDLYKLLYLKLKNKEIPKRFRRKFYYPELISLLESLLSLLNIRKGGFKYEP